MEIDQEKGWVALENEFKNIVDSFQEFHELHNQEQLLVIEPAIITSKNFRLRNFCKFIDISSNIVTPKLNNFEFRISMAVLNNKAYIYHNQENETVLCMNTLKNKMKLDFLELKKDLEIYLMNTFRVKYKIADVEKFKSYFSQFSQVTVLNFNYNKDINRYINKPDNWNVHGVIKDDRKSIILGHNKIENLEFCEFNKEIDIWDK